MLTIQQKLEHLRTLGIDGNLSEIEKMYEGKEFDIHDSEYKKLLELSKKYCIRFTELSSLISKAQTQEEKDAYNQEKNDIFVDCIGTVKIGNDVKIGNSPTLAGNITIGDNVKIGNNVALQTTGHEIYYKWRKITSDKNGSLCEISTPGYIIVFPELILADGTKVIPDQTLRRNTHKDETITHSR